MSGVSGPKSISELVDLGLCTGCGACAFASPDTLAMRMNANGHLTPVHKGGSSEPAAQELLRLCPMSGAGTDETEFAERLWPDLPQDRQIGRYRRTLATHLVDTEARLASGSGGIVTWLAMELLRRGEVDCVIHVKPGKTGERPLFRYAVSRSPEEVQAGAKSRYYPIELSGVLSELKARGERAAIIAIPCFIKAIRKLIEQGALEEWQAPYLIGLVCGHLKSSFFGEYLAWQMGIAPDDLASCDFRHKLMDRKASTYGFAARALGDTDDEAPHISPMAHLKGRDWGEGQMRLTGCEFCDDVLAECADIAIGDAWLPKYVSDPKGENVVVIRDARIDAIVSEGCERGELVADNLCTADVVQSQSSGLRHRREGLAHRLARRVEAGLWAPHKRVKPQLAPSPARREIYDIRLEIAETSNPAFARARAAGDIAIYQSEMADRLARLHRLRHVSLPRKVWRKLLQKGRGLLGRSAA